MEFGESFAACALRELQEETGIEPPQVGVTPYDISRTAEGNLTMNENILHACMHAA